MQDGAYGNTQLKEDRLCLHVNSNNNFPTNFSLISSKNFIFLVFQRSVGKSLNYLENLLVKEVVNYKPNIITIMSNRNAVLYDSYGNSSVSADIIDGKLDYFLYKLNKFLSLLFIEKQSLAQTLVLYLLINPEYAPELEHSIVFSS